MQRPFAKAAALTLSIAAHGAALGAFFLPRPAALVQAPTEESTPLEPRGLEGDSFEIPAPNAESDDLPAAPNGPSPGAPEPPRPSGPRARAAHAPSTEGDAPPKAAGGHSGARDTPQGSAQGGEGGEGPAVYGAAGDRSAVDLATAVTRGFPQAASADPQWATVPIGPGGEATLVLTLDETGKLQASEVVGYPEPCPRRRDPAGIHLFYLLTINFLCTTSLPTMIRATYVPLLIVSGSGKEILFDPVVFLCFFESIILPCISRIFISKSPVSIDSKRIVRLSFAGLGATVGNNEGYQ